MNTFLKKVDTIIDFQKNKFFIAYICLASCVIGFFAPIDYYLLHKTVGIEDENLLHIEVWFLRYSFSATFLLLFLGALAKFFLGNKPAWLKKIVTVYDILIIGSTLFSIAMYIYIAVVSTHFLTNCMERFSFTVLYIAISIVFGALYYTSIYTWTSSVVLSKKIIGEDSLIAGNSDVVDVLSKYDGILPFTVYFLFSSSIGIILLQGLANIGAVNWLKEVFTNELYKWDIGIAQLIIILSTLLFIYYLSSMYGKYMLSIKEISIVRNKLKQTNEELNLTNLQLAQQRLEMDHRIKNNLHQLNGLIQLRKLSPELRDNEIVCNELNGIQGGVLSIGEIHKLLYSNDVSALSIQAFLEGMKTHLTNIIRRQPNIDCSGSASKVLFNRDTIFPLGLVLNELITNSYKHAFKNQPNPHITIDINPLDEQYYQLVYTDNGCGIPLQETQTGLGQKIISTNINTLKGGKPNVQSSPEGITVIFKFIHKKT